MLVPSTSSSHSIHSSSRFVFPTFFVFALDSSGKLTLPRPSLALTHQQRPFLLLLLHLSLLVTVWFPQTTIQDFHLGEWWRMMRCQWSFLAFSSVFLSCEAISVSLSPCLLQSWFSPNAILSVKIMSWKCVVSKHCWFIFVLDFKGSHRVRIQWSPNIQQKRGPWRLPTLGFQTLASWTFFHPWKRPRWLKVPKALGKAWCTSWNLSMTTLFLDGGFWLLTSWNWNWSHLSCICRSRVTHSTIFFHMKGLVFSPYNPGPTDVAKTSQDLSWPDDVAECQTAFRSNDVFLPRPRPSSCARWVCYDQDRWPKTCSMAFRIKGWEVNPIL